MTLTVRNHRTIRDLVALDHLNEIFDLAIRDNDSQPTMLAMKHFIAINGYIIKYLDREITLDFANHSIHESCIIIESQRNKKDPSSLTLLKGTFLSGGIYKVWDWFYFQNYWTLIQHNFDMITHELKSISQKHKLASLKVFKQLLGPLYECFDTESISLSCNINVIMGQKFSTIVNILSHISNATNFFSKKQIEYPIAIDPTASAGILVTIPETTPFSLTTSAYNAGKEVFGEVLRIIGQKCTEGADDVTTAINTRINSIKTTANDLINSIIVLLVVLGVAWLIIFYMKYVVKKNLKKNADSAVEEIKSLTKSQKNRLELKFKSIKKKSKSKKTKSKSKTKSKTKTKSNKDF